MSFYSRFRSSGSLTPGRLRRPSGGFHSRVRSPGSLTVSHELAAQLPVSQPCQTIWFSYWMGTSCFRRRFHSRVKIPGSLTQDGEPCRGSRFTAVSNHLNLLRNTRLREEQPGFAAVSDHLVLILRRAGEHETPVFQSRARSPGSLTWAKR